MQKNLILFSNQDAKKIVFITKLMKFVISQLISIMNFICNIKINLIK